MKISTGRADAAVSGVKTSSRWRSAGPYLTSRSLIRFLLLHRREQRRGPGRIDDAAYFPQLPDEILRHRGLLRGGRAGEEDSHCGQQRLYLYHPDIPSFLVRFSVNVADTAGNADFE